MMASKSANVVPFPRASLQTLWVNTAIEMLRVQANFYASFWGVGTKPQTARVLEFRRPGMK